MHKLSVFILFLLVTFWANGQQKEIGNKAQIKQALATFMTCLIAKDSNKFYSLFAPEPVTWVGVFKEKSQQDRVLNGKATKNYFTSTYQKFYRSISNIGADEEKFYNVKIIEDGSIATVMFDYSFWEKGKKINWGKENWAMVKLNGEWKIASVLFSLEMENINPEDKRTKQKK